MRHTQEFNKQTNDWNSGLCKASDLRISVVLLTLLWSMSAIGAGHSLAPLYKPSGRSLQAMDIRLPDYGASQNAPRALTIGDTVADFKAPRAGGGSVDLAELRASGPVVIVFYRGHW